MDSSEEQLNVLFISDTLFADVTFKVCPRLFGQLYVIHDIQHVECMFLFFSLITIAIHKSDREKRI